MSCTSDGWLTLGFVASKDPTLLSLLLNTSAAACSQVGTHIAAIFLIAASVSVGVSATMLV